MSPAPLHTLVLKSTSLPARQRLSPFVLIAVIVVGLFVPSAEDGGWPWFRILNRVVAAVCMCSIVHTFEHAVHARFVRHGSVVRLMVQTALLLSGFVGGLIAVYLVGLPLKSIGDGGTALVAIVCGTLWLLSASMGSVLVMVLDRLIRPLTQEFRSRMNAAVLALVSMTALIAYWAAQIGYDAVRHTGDSMPSIFTLDMGFGPVWTY